MGSGMAMGAGTEFWPAQREVASSNTAVQAWREYRTRRWHGRPGEVSKQAGRVGTRRCAASRPRLAGRRGSATQVTLWPGYRHALSLGRDVSLFGRAGTALALVFRLAITPFDHITERLGAARASWQLQLTGSVMYQHGWRALRISAIFSTEGDHGAT